MIELVFAAALVAGGPMQDASAIAPQPAKEKKICRSIVPTGTIVAKRFCLSKDQWAKLADENGKHAQMREDRRSALDKRTMGDRGNGASDW